MMKEEVQLRDKGHDVVIHFTVVDGPSHASTFVVGMLLRFIKDEITYEAMTDTNHNGKNLR